jgi:hypothetical protein
VTRLAVEGLSVIKVLAHRAVKGYGSVIRATVRSHIATIWVEGMGPCLFTEIDKGNSGPGFSPRYNF